MGRKTITIDLEAYALLKARKRPGQNFSSVIKENFRKNPTGKDLMRVLPMLTLEEETPDHMEEQIKRRRLDNEVVPHI